MKLKSPRKKSASRAPRPREFRAQLVRRGKARALKLPKAILDEGGINEKSTLRLREGYLVIESAKNARAGWEAAFKKAIAKNGNELTEEDREWLDAPLNPEFDEKEWTW